MQLYSSAMRKVENHLINKSADKGVMVDPKQARSRMTGKELAKRYILFIISLFFSGLGVAFTKHAELGVSPISSVANVMCIKFPVLSMGNWLIIWNCLLILGQILLLRKDFQIIQLLQIPLSVLFGYFTDLGLIIVRPIPVSSYPLRLLCVLIGILILGFGISLSVIANVIMNSGEAFVKAIVEITKKEFGSVKRIFDISCVVTAVILSLILFDFKIMGIREGTIITAVLTGTIVNIYNRTLRWPLEKVLR